MVLLFCLQLLTRLGRKMAEFPLEPQLSKMLIIRYVYMKIGAHA